MFGTMEHLKREHPDMGLRKPKPVYTVDDYLRIDRTGQERYVFLDGEIYDFAFAVAKSDLADPAAARQPPRPALRDLQLRDLHQR